MGSLSIWSVTGLFVAASIGVASAQESRATIIGRATDPSGAVLSGANVKATNIATNANVETVTNDSGSFEMPYMLPGVYTVTVEMAGFKKAVRENVQLRIGERVTLDFALSLGDVSESVKVTAETTLLEASSADMGLVMEQRRVQELPVVGGNPFYLTRLSAGVLSNGGRSAGNPMDNGGATGIIVNGTRANSSEATVDGSPVMANRNASFSPPQDLVQEFKVNTATYDASIGHAAGAMTNVSMKSGTNALHGTAFLDRSTTRAVPWFTNRFIYDPRNKLTPAERDAQIPSWLHRRGGNTMTGPVWIPKVYNGKNKTFWTFGFEDLLIQRNLSFTGTVRLAQTGRILSNLRPPHDCSCRQRPLQPHAACRKHHSGQPHGFCRIQNHRLLSESEPAGTERRGQEQLLHHAVNQSGELSVHEPRRSQLLTEEPHLLPLVQPAARQRCQPAAQSHQHRAPGSHSLGRRVGRCTRLQPESAFECPIRNQL
jgi:hypothetical protein